MRDRTAAAFSFFSVVGFLFFSLSPPPGGALKHGFSITIRIKRRAFFSPPAKSPLSAHTAASAAAAALMVMGESDERREKTLLITPLIAKITNDLLNTHRGKVLCCTRLNKKKLIVNTPVSIRRLFYIFFHPHRPVGVLFISELSSNVVRIVSRCITHSVLEYGGG